MVLGSLRLRLGPDVARPRMALENVYPFLPRRDGWKKGFLLGEHVPPGMSFQGWAGGRPTDVCSLVLTLLLSS